MLENNLLYKIKELISSRQLLSLDALVIVGLSGGADSVALLHILKTLGYQCYAVHINFNLRAEASLNDQRFCENLCKEWGIPLAIFSYQTKTLAQQAGVSIEMMARELRYKHFEQIKEEKQAQAIAVAHHLQDNVETLLLNLCRGTGIKGITAMEYKQYGIVRPLLNVEKKEIIAYLKSLGQGFQEDHTNQIADVKRNFLRLKVLPLLQHLNPQLLQTFSTNINHFQAALHYYQKGISQARKQITLETSPNTILSIPLLQKEQEKETLLFEILHPLGFNSQQVTQIISQLEGNSGAIYESPTHQLLRDRHQLIIKAKEITSFPALLLEKVKNVKLDEEHCLTMKIVSRESLQTLRCANDTALLDVDRVRFPLTYRSIKKGDKFSPFGMKGTQLVSDFLTNQKASFFEKQTQALLLDVHKQPLWLVNRRIDNFACVTSKTQNILVLTIKKTKTTSIN